MRVFDRIVYAHTLSDQPPDRWEPLDRHLEQVAQLADTFAQEFHAGPWGRLAGHFHDLGKASAAFQGYLQSHSVADVTNASEERTSRARVDHSTFGARYASAVFPGFARRLLAFCIAGHHAGLPDAMPSDEAKARSTLRVRLDPSHPIEHVDITTEAINPPSLPVLRCAQRSDQAFSLAFFTRMVFSCLIDADRTCTEAFCDPDKAVERGLRRPSLADLRGEIDQHLQKKQQDAQPTAVNEQRRSILQQCLRAASGPPGFYSLQVPTGGGKTLSSLAFALHHARGSMRRVVMAIPFTSIIEQTANVYREALGPHAERALIEHHTNIRPDRDTRANQMASENWDAPLIVTTNVQLFESLFAAATTPCRKLHRLANSVIILDEAQTLPTDLLAPTLRALRELVENYGCTVVLCTATQPALQAREEFSIGLPNVTPIIADPGVLFQTMRRVEVKRAGKLSDDELAERLTAEDRVLCIVNTRTHAAKLFESLKKRGDSSTVFHLSTLMCGAHRRQVLGKIRKRLDPVSGSRLPCRIVSTSLIEAGVDLDLPVVYRASAGFDSIAQAAGRCNREGSSPLGTTWVFDAEQEPPPGMQRDGAVAAKELWDQFPDPLTPAAVEQYFRLRYWKHSDRWDHHKVMECMQIGSRAEDLLFQFRDMEERYVLIGDKQLPILIPFGKEGKYLLSQLQSPFVDFVAHRKLQPYLVSMPDHVVRELEREGVLQAHESGIWLLLRDDAYTLQMGLEVRSIGLDARAWAV